MTEKIFRAGLLVGLGRESAPLAQFSLRDGRSSDIMAVSSYPWIAVPFQIRLS